MTIVKPMRLGLLTRAHREPPKVYFFVTALGYFDLHDPSDFDLETKMWPMVAGALGGTPLDVAMPKPRGEVLVVGEAAAPGGAPVTQMAVEFAVGPVRKRLTVFGDRHWEMSADGPVFTRPLPFTRMPLGWDRGFGGPEYPANPAGTGHGARAVVAEGRRVRLPNIEDAGDLILDVDHTPQPVGCAPIDVMSPLRQRFAGTYDGDWLKRHFPGHALDFDWAFYNTAPPDQWLPGFLTGDERIRITGMHPDHPVIESRLPGMRVRAFVNLERDGRRTLNEVDMRCETVTLFPGALKGVVTYRGGCGIADIDGKDVVDTVLAYERLDEEPRPVEHYARTLNARTDPETAALSFFDEKPLRPEIPEIERAEREAEREAVATEREEKWDKRVESMIGRIYGAVGALPPPPGSIPKFRLPVPIPTISPGDIERMDVDMVGVSNAMKKLKAYGDEQTALARQYAGSLLSGIAGAVAGPAGSLVDAASAAKIRGAALSFPAPMDGAPSALPGDVPTLDGLRQSLAGSDGVDPDSDPFADVVAALQAMAAGDGPLTEAEKTVLRARAEGQPEGGIAAAMVGQVEGLDLTAGGKVAPPAMPAAGGGGADVDGFLAQLGLDGAASPIAQALGGSGADLMKPLMAAQPPQPEIGADPVDQLKSTVDGIAGKLEEAFQGGRRLSPEPLAPLEPMTAEASRYLGEAVQRSMAAGGDFVGRDWAGATLAGVDFSGRDLRGAFFERADLTGAVFRGAVLEAAVFTGATLVDADFSNCDMRAVNLSGVDASGAKFVGSDLSDARLMATRLTGADLSGATLENTIALNIDLAGADLRQGRSTKVIFMTSNLDAATLDGADFQRCVFLQCAMSRLSARGTVFARCALVDCQQRDGDFTGADFSDTGSLGGAVYDGSIMRDLVAARSGWHAASMVGVDLHAARFDGADLGKADLTDASLTRASLRGAVMVETVMAGADATAATFMEAVMRRVDLRGASLRHANLYRAGIDETDLTCCDLTGVNSTGTNLMRAVDVA